MAVESGARASNTLSGELRSRPLPVLLAGACDRGTSGTFTFRHGKRTDIVTMRRGKIAVVRTSDPIAYLGGVLYELGAIDVSTLNTTLLEVAGARRLHGDVLLERGAITRERLADALAEQTFRKTHHLFTLPEAATWTFRDDVDDLGGTRDEDRPPIDTWQAIWRGLRDQPVASHVRRTLAKVDGGIQLRDLKVVDAFGLAPDERMLCERLFAQPTTLAVLASTSPLSIERTELLVYLLALSRRVVRVEPQPVSPTSLGVDGIRERARHIDQEDPKTVLGLRGAVSVEAARAAYFRLARLWHPERLPAELSDVRSECEHIFARLGDAHRMLTDSDATTASRITMRDVDAALARNDLEMAAALARTLSSAGSAGPAARAVVAWCDAGGGRSSSPESLERAFAALDKIVTGDPECVHALFYRGQMESRLGRIDAALRDYRRVVRLDPSHEGALRELRLHSDSSVRSGLRLLVGGAAGK
jgi:hypothetical protein